MAFEHSKIINLPTTAHVTTSQKNKPHLISTDKVKICDNKNKFSVN